MFGSPCSAIASVGSFLSILSVLVSGTAYAQDGRDDRRADAVRTMSGTWEVVDADIARIAKINVSKVGEELLIRFWPTGNENLAAADVESHRLLLLSRYDDSKLAGAGVANGYAMVQSTTSSMLFTIKVRGQEMKVEGIKLMDDPDGDHRIINAAYAKAGSARPAAMAASDGDQNGGEDEDEDDQGDREVTRGVVKGTVQSGSTLRGRLSLVPADEEKTVDAKISPADGIEVGQSSPAFRFSNVPEGEYELQFEGTINNVRQTLRWSGLKVQTADTRVTNDLSIRSAKIR